MLFTLTVAVAQCGSLPSLLNELKKSKEDTSKVLLLIKIGYEYEITNLDSAAYYYQAGGTLSKKINYDIGVLKYISNYTAILNAKNKFEQSLQLNLQAVELAKKINNQKQLAVANANVGASYYGLRSMDNCIQYFLKGIYILEELKDSAYLVVSYMNMAGLYSEMEEQDQKGYAYGLKAYSIATQLKDTINMIGALNNTAGILIDLAKYDSAMVILNQSNSMAIITNNKTAQVSALTNICYINSKTKNISDLQIHADTLLKISTENNEEEGLSNSYQYLGRCLFEKKKFSEAKIYIEKMLAIDLRLGLNKSLQVAYQNMSQLELALGNLAAFHENLAKSDSVSDRIMNDKIQHNIQDFEAKYSLDKKQSEINDLIKDKQIKQLKLRQQQITNLVLIALLLLIAIIGYLFYRNGLQKRKLLETEATLQRQKISEFVKEKELLAAESILQGQEEERKRLAKDLHDGLGSILSSTKYSFNNMKNNLIISPENAIAFDKSIAMLDQSIQELRMIAHNMMPEALVKFGLDTALKDFCESINLNTPLQLTYQSFDLTDDTISKNMSSSIYRIVQELVNNILKHANAKTALVQLVKKEDKLSITVEDNGKGFDTADLKNNAGSGYTNLQNRVTYIKGVMDIHSSIDSGTSVTIDIQNLVHD